MEKLNIAPGPWGKTKSKGGRNIYSKDGQLICKITNQCSNVESHADFITEAGTVANETGLTPRQLLEQRNELLEALRLLQAETNAYPLPKELRLKISTAIQNAQR